jgi:hypothetical protein
VLDGHLAAGDGQVAAQSVELAGGPGGVGRLNAALELLGVEPAGHRVLV